MRPFSGVRPTLRTLPLQPEELGGSRPRLEQSEPWHRFLIKPNTKLMRKNRSCNESYYVCEYMYSEPLKSYFTIASVVLRAIRTTLCQVRKQKYGYLFYQKLNLIYILVFNFSTFGKN